MTQGFIFSEAKWIYPDAKKIKHCLRNASYCKRIVFGVYDIWQKMVCEQVDVDLN